MWKWHTLIMVVMVTALVNGHSSRCQTLAVLISCRFEWLKLSFLETILTDRRYFGENTSPRSVLESASEASNEQQVLFRINHEDMLHPFRSEAKVEKFNRPSRTDNISLLACKNHGGARTGGLLSTMGPQVAHTHIFPTPNLCPAKKRVMRFACTRHWSGCFSS